MCGFCLWCYDLPSGVALAGYCPELDRAEFSGKLRPLSFWSASLSARFMSAILIPAWVNVRKFVAACGSFFGGLRMRSKASLQPSYSIGIGVTIRGIPPATLELTGRTFGKSASA